MKIKQIGKKVEFTFRLPTISKLKCFAGRSRYKQVLADDLIKHFDPIRLKIEDYLKNREYLVAVLKDGRDRASETAEKTIKEVKTRIGLNIL